MNLRQSLERKQEIGQIFKLLLFPQITFRILWLSNDNSLATLTKSNCEFFVDLLFVRGVVGLQMEFQATQPRELQSYQKVKFDLSLLFLGQRRELFKDLDLRNDFLFKMSQNLEFGNLRVNLTHVLKRFGGGKTSEQSWG